MQFSDYTNPFPLSMLLLRLLKGGRSLADVQAEVDRMLAERDIVQVERQHRDEKVRQRGLLPSKWWLVQLSDGRLLIDTEDYWHPIDPKDIYIRERLPPPPEPRVIMSARLAARRAREKMAPPDVKPPEVADEETPKPVSAEPMATAPAATADKAPLETEQAKPMTLREAGIKAMLDMVLEAAAWLAPQLSPNSKVDDFEDACLKKFSDRGLTSSTYHKRVVPTARVLRGWPPQTPPGQKPKPKPE